VASKTSIRTSACIGLRDIVHCEVVCRMQPMVLDWLGRVEGRRAGARARSRWPPPAVTVVMARRVVEGGGGQKG
jgi:hypothetical protein